MRKQYRPCLCDDTQNCRRCWLYHNDPRYRELWSLPLPVATLVEESPVVQPRPLGLVRKIMNFAPAVVRHVADGMRYVSEGEAKRRVAICEQCPLFNASVRECTHQKCGCKIDRKAPWSSSACPDGRW